MGVDVVTIQNIFGENLGLSPYLINIIKIGNLGHLLRISGGEENGWFNGL